jgi:thioredoxin 1
MAAISELQDATFESKVLRSSKPVLVDFSATWCAPCKQIAPIVEELANEHAGKVDFYLIDTDTQRESAIRFGVRGMPTLILFKDGKPVGQLTGFQPKSKIESLLKQAS